jgi:serine/threonine protein kinase
MPRLVVEKGIDKGTYLDVTSRNTYLVGRDASSHLRLRDMMASRHHFRLEGREGAIWLVDLMSMNGTYVNGERIQNARLSLGDHIQVGETLFDLIADEDVVAQDERIGTILAGYLIQERVGHGGMGTVYRAEQISLKRTVALKVISEEHTKEPAFVDLFLREARAAAQLNHPNIVQVYDAKGVEGAYFYSMEFVPHGSVQDVLSAEKKLPPERAVRMTLHAARGLEYAERKDIVHRDIKPDNLMIGELEVVKIADLGLAQSAKEASRMDDSRTVLGTPHYIAPELVLGKPPDHRVDIYSLGASLYRMLSGTTPYTGSNVTEIVQNKIRQDPPELNELDPAIPKSLSDIVCRMMARDPAARYQKVSEVVAALERFLSAPGSTLPAGAPSEKRRLPLPWLVAGAAALLAVVIAAIYLFGRRDGSRPVPPPPNHTSPTPPPGSTEHENKLAKVYIQAAMDFEAKQLKKDSVTSIRDNIALYQKVVDECPRSNHVKEAEARIAALRALMTRAAAQDALREAESSDAAAFQALAQSAQKEPPTLDRIRTAAREAADKFAKVEQAHPDSEAAQRARQIRDHLQGWTSRVEAAYARIAEVETAAQPESSGQRFGTALSHWQAFLQDCQSKAPPSPFKDGRYGELLVAGAVRRRIQDLQAEAARAFDKLHQEAATLLAAEKFDEAKSCYRRVLETFGIPDLDARARREISAVDKKIIEKLDQERREREKQERQRLQEEDQRFRQFLLNIQDLLKRYEFQKAVEALRADAASLTSEKNKAAAALRLQDLESLARLKNEFIRRANDPEARDFVRAMRSKTQPGDIVGANDDRITLSTAGGLAEMPIRWTEFTPREFCGLFRSKATTGEISPRWTMTAADLLCLGSAHLEFGLFDEAEDVLKAAQAKATDDALRLAVARRLEELSTAKVGSANREAEAGRRLTRAKTFAEQKRYLEAKQELDVLLKLLADTETVRKSRADVELLLRQVNEKAKEEEGRNRRSQTLQRHKDAMALELKESQTRRREVRDHLPFVTNDIERRVETLVNAMAWQEWREATIAAEELRLILPPRLPSIAAGELGIPAKAYRSMLQLAVLNGDKAGFDQLAKEAAAALASYGPWAGQDAPELAKWQSETYPVALADVKKLKANIESEHQPDLLWRLCVILHHDVPLRLEERQHLRALLETQPDHPQVANGDVLYRLAENAIAFREIQRAQSLFAKLKTKYPDHPRVKEPDVSGSADRLLRYCDELAQKFGYAKK